MELTGCHSQSPICRIKSIANQSVKVRGSVKLRSKAGKQQSKLTCIFWFLRIPLHHHGSRYVFWFFDSRARPPRERRTRTNARALPSTLSGESGLGKSTLINTLFNTSLYGKKAIPGPAHDRSKTVSIESITAGKLWFFEHGAGRLWANFGSLFCLLFFFCFCCGTIDIEENGVRLRLTVVDTPGYEISSITMMGTFAVLQFSERSSALPSLY